MRGLTLLTVLFLGLAPPPCLPAQEWGPDSGVSRLAWGTVNVIVRADSVDGLQVWANTSPVAYTGSSLAFFAGFDPDAVSDWLDGAYRVVGYPATSDSTAVALETPRLSARNGGQLALLRRRKKTKWENQATVMFLDRDGAYPWGVQAKLSEAEEFLQALLTQAHRSRLLPDSNATLEANPLNREACPWPLAGNPKPEYPAGLSWAEKSGEVWVLFVVQADGTPDPTSFRTVLSDHPAFTRAAVAALRVSRYSPGRVAGHAVPMLVAQRVVFQLH